MEQAVILARGAARCRPGLVLAALAVIAGCGLMPVSSSYQGLSDFRVLSSGHEEGGGFCSDFRLTASQAQWFFSRATALDARQLHDRFDHLPCWVRGTAASSQGRWEWEIRAGGTARLTARDGRVELMGCARCEQVLSGAAVPDKKPE